MQQNINWRYELEDGTIHTVVITEEHLRPASYLVRNKLGIIIEENAAKVRSVTENHEFLINGMDPSSEAHRKQMTATIDEINAINTSCHWSVIDLILVKDRDVILSPSFKANCDEGILTEIVSSFRSKIRK